MVNNDFLQGNTVMIEDNIMDEGRECFRIKAQNAVYYYDKKGGGFTSILDVQGNDWIGYKEGNGPKGEYRGIPNLVHPEAYFHPGSPKEDMVSSIVSTEAHKVKICTESKDKNWVCVWEFYPDYSRLEVVKADKPYWFLYEGTPGGSLDTERDYGFKSDGIKFSLSESWDCILPSPKWVCFVDHNSNRGLYVVHHEHDNVVDSYWPMEESMTVFGFGRYELEKHLNRAPAVFTIGLIEDCSFDTINNHVKHLVVE